MSQFTETTSFLGSQVVNYFRAILERLDKKLAVISHKSTFCISEADYNNLNTALIKLEHSIDDLQFAFDKRAIQTSLDDMVMNVNLATYHTRNLANIYNFNKLIWTLNEIGVASSIIEDIQQKKEIYRTEHHTDPYALSRKWYKKISSGFVLICQKCGFAHKDVDLIEAQLPDKTTRRNPD